MTTTTFTIPLIGAPKAAYRAELSAELIERTGGLHSGDRLDLPDQVTLAAQLSNKNAAAVVFGRKEMEAAEIAAINACEACGMPIIPVVQDLAKFADSTPAEVGKFNGFQLADARDVGELTGLLLELVGLQRAKRKIFISYARQDASAIALQLRSALIRRWYTVFLDTVSIRPGVVFQERLKEELADCDVVLFLDSPNARGRKYVEDELAFAAVAGLGGIQVTWPGPDRAREGGLFTLMRLGNDDFDTDELGITRFVPGTVASILRKIAEERIEVQRKREQRVFAPIEAYAKDNGWEAKAFLGRHIELTRRAGGDPMRLDVVLGIPTSRDIEQAFTEGTPKPPRDQTSDDKTSEGRLVYNPLGITNAQSEHLRFFLKALKLEFFDPNDPLQFLDPNAVPQWSIP